MGIKTEDRVLVDHIYCKQLKNGKILEIHYETKEALLSIIWPNDKKGQYWPEELDFIVNREY